MKGKTIFILCLLTCMVSGAYAKIGQNNNYKVISEDKFHELSRNANANVFTQFIVVPQIYKKKLAKSIASYNDSDSIYVATLCLLAKGKSTFVWKFLNNQSDEALLHNLLMGVYYLSQLNYATALLYFEKEESLNYQFLNSLLIADCKNALAKINYDRKAVFDYYQIAYDQTTDPVWRKMVKDRLRRIKYAIK